MPELPLAAGLDPSGRRLARGTVIVAAGLGVTGSATLAMIALVDASLGKSPATAFNLWWLSTTLLSTVFGVFEVALYLIHADKRQRHVQPLVAGDRRGDLRLRAQFMGQRAQPFVPGVHVRDQAGQGGGQVGHHGVADAGGVDVGDLGEGFPVGAAHACESV